MLDDQFLRTPSSARVRDYRLGGKHAEHTGDHGCLGRKP
jgi:hypothetical protein